MDYGVQGVGGKKAAFVCLKYCLPFVLDQGKTTRTFAQNNQFPEGVSNLTLPEYDLGMLLIALPRCFI